MSGSERVALTAWPSVAPGWWASCPVCGGKAFGAWVGRGVGFVWICTASGCGARRPIPAGAPRPIGLRIVRHGIAPGDGPPSNWRLVERSA